jgi:hypothetical protein
MVESATTVADSDIPYIHTSILNGKNQPPLLILIFPTHLPIALNGRNWPALLILIFPIHLCIKWQNQPPLLIPIFPTLPRPQYFDHCWFWCCIISIYCFKLQDLATSAIWYFLPTYALNCRIDHQRWFWNFLLNYTTTDYLQSVFRLEGQEKSRAVLWFFFQ